MRKKSPAPLSAWHRGWVVLVLLGGVAQGSAAAPPLERERIAFHHTTEYTYDRPVVLGPHIIRLLPQSWTPATVTRHELRLDVGGSYSLRRQLDLENNLVAAVWFKGETRSLTIENRFTIEIPVEDRPAELRPEPRAVAFPIQYLPDESKRLAAYLERGPPPGPRFEAFVAGLPKKHASSVGWLGEVNRRIHEKVKSFERLEEGVLSPEETLERGGSCRDLAWLLVQVSRRNGVPARFVSGYQIPPGMLAKRDRKVHPAELHAWVEAYLPGAGWVGLDPTAGRWTNASYIPVAASATPRDAGPLHGTFRVASAEPGVFAKSTLRFKITGQRLGPVEP
jgi:transglutaminase-like putative cysteine protease